MAGCTVSAITKRLWSEEQRERARSRDLLRNEEKRAWENSHRYPCEGCGELLAGGTMRSDGSFRKRYPTSRPRCQTCRQEERFLDVMSMYEMARAGHTHKEIAERLQRPLQTVHQEMSRMRRLGFEVPYDPYFDFMGRHPRPFSNSAKAEDEAQRLGRTLRKFGVALPALDEEWTKVRVYLDALPR